MKKNFKKSLAVLLSVLAIIFCLSTVVFAAGNDKALVKIETCTPNKNAKTVTVSASAAKTTNASINDELSEISYSISPEKDVLKNELKDGSVMFSNLELGVEYTVTAEVTLDLYGGGSEKYDDEKTFTLEKDPTDAPADFTYTEITATSVTLKQYSGAKYKVGTGEWKDSNVFTGLTTGTEYTFYCYFPETATNKASEVVITKVTPRNTQSKPTSASYSYTRTSTTIKFSQGSSLKADLQVRFKGQGEADWKTIPTGGFTFDLLEPETSYTFEMRFNETSNYLASDYITFSLSTKKAGSKSSIAPLPEAITNTSITLKAVEGYEYSKDGKNFQKSNKFTGLSAGQVYTFYQRVIFDSENQEASENSTALKLKTNKDANFIASKTNSTFTITSSKIYSSNQTTGFKVTAVTAPAGTAAQTGDTRLIPSHVVFTKGTSVAVAKLYLSEGVYTGSYTFPEAGDYTVKVVYRVEKYWLNITDGKIKTDTSGVATLSWQDSGEVEAKDCGKVTAGAEYNQAQEWFSTIINWFSDFAKKIANWINSAIK